MFGLQVIFTVYYDGEGFWEHKTLILESFVISQVFVTLCNLYNFQALRYSYIFIQLVGLAVNL